MTPPTLESSNANQSNMLLPRRRITLLTLLTCTTLVILWYLDYIPEVPSSALQWPISKPNVKITPSNPPSTTPSNVSSEMISDTQPNPTPKPKSDAPTKSRFTSGQHTFGSRVFLQKHPVKDYAKFNHGLPLPLKKLQHNFEAELPEAKVKRLDRLEAVRATFEHAWQGYKKRAMGKDELLPIDGGAAESFGGWGATLVDTLDTLWIMGMKDEFEDAVVAVIDIDFNTSNQETISVFETTIRYLGGLLAAHDLTEGAYPVLLEKAIEVGELLYCAFDTPNRMPATRWSWKEALEGADQVAGEATLIADIGSLSLEFTRLSQITGDMKYFDAIQRIVDILDENQSKTMLPGLWPVVMNAKSIAFTHPSFTLGAMADSLYEYLPKEYMLLGGRSEQIQKMYEYAITAAMNHIFFQPMTPDNRDILISGGASVDKATKNIVSDPAGQHLGCYAGGMVGIGAILFDHGEHMNMARKLVDGCIWAYDQMPTGIMPEMFRMVACEMNSDCVWDEKVWKKAVIQSAKNQLKEEDKQKFPSDEALLNHTVAHKHLKSGFVDIWDPRYLLRPEAIESVFVHYRLTGDSDLPDAAWRMFENIEKHTRTEFGNAMIDDVTVQNPKKQNKMESFWLAETLKYFYLIFSEPDVVSLDAYVL